MATDGRLLVESHLMEHVYKVPPRAIKVLAARLQTAEKTAYV
jgi:hypothetical protein